MRKIAFLIFPFAMLAWSLQDREPELSEKPLTAEQVSIYRAFLLDYLGNEDQGLNIANTTQGLDLGSLELKQGRGCLREIYLENLKQAQWIVHTVGPEIAVNPRISFVDPARQREQITQNDPSKTMNEGKDVKTAVQDAFGSGLFTFSEIGFNKTHTWAVMMFSFRCGMLCGQGGAIVLHKIKGVWKVTSRECGRWIS